MNFIRKITLLYGEQLVLALIIATGLWFRLYHLGYQSFWVDELHTAIEIDPALADFSLLHYLRHVDQQPPLFFIFERFSIWIFGNTEASLRLVPAIAGAGGVWAIYLLGRAVYSKRLGLYAAAILAVNPFSIQYSQEARPYTLVLFFAILSWLFMVRLMREPTLKNSILFAVSTLFVIYTNYFGFLVLASQMLVGTISWLDHPYRKKFFIYFLLSGIIIALAYIPWLPYLKVVSGMQVFWAAKPAEDVAIDYFFEYFGHSDLLKPLLLLLLISYFVHLFSRIHIKDPELRSRSIVGLFTICSVWIFIGFFIPYVRSILLVPMMVPRYTITILPAFVLLLAGGMEVIAAPMVKRILLCMFCLLSLTHIFVSKNYYQTISKTQFRELAQFMSNDTATIFPVVTERTAWHHRYYLNRFNYHAPVLGGNRKQTLDSLTHHTDHRSGFWLTGAHGEAKPDEQTYRSLDSAYMLLKEVNLFECWGQLFIPRDYFGAGAVVIKAESYPEADRIIQDGQEALIPFWNQSFSNGPINLKAGKYQYVIVAKGTPLAGIYPHLHCFVNDQELGSFFVDGHQRVQKYQFELQTDAAVTLRLISDNDDYDLAKREDRNVFIHSIIIASAR